MYTYLDSYLEYCYLNYIRPTGYVQFTITSANFHISSAPLVIFSDVFIIAQMIKESQILFLNWGNRIRTDGCSSQSAVPYRLAIPQWVDTV